MVEKSEELDLAFAALADPTRRAILDRLARSGPATVGEVATPFDMSLAAVSKHVGVLERAGLVSAERRGRTRVVSARPDALARARAWLQRQERFWQDRLDRLEVHLAEPGSRAKHPGDTSARAH